MKGSDFKAAAETQQKCMSVTDTCYASARQLLQGACARLAAGEDVACVLRDTDAAYKQSNVVKSVSNMTRAYHESIRALNQIVGDSFDQDVSAAARRNRLPPVPLNQVILDYLYREGHFRAAAAFTQEASISDCSHARDIFSDMHRLLSEIRAGHLASALQWVQNHFARSNRQATRLEFNFHRLIFLQTLQTSGRQAALKYARSVFPIFKDTLFEDIKPMMGCLLFQPQSLASTPYAHFTSASMLEEVAREFVLEACGILAQAVSSPLAVAIAAGSVALPQLLKLARVSKSALPLPDSDLATCPQMPIELELGPEFNFHSIFACPVSKEQTDKANPPMLLPCGHVLASQSIDSIANQRLHTLKCPYCPQECSPNLCRPLFFPDIG